VDVFALVVRWVIAPAWALWEGSPYLWQYRHLYQTQFDPPAVIRRRQWQRIEELVKHAYDTTRFWRGRFEAINLKPGDVQSFDDFQRIPLLTKSDLRASRKALLSDKYKLTSLHCARTSGSTGVPVEVFSSDATRQFQRACTLRSDEWSGWHLGQRVGAIWGNAAQEFRGLNWRGYLRNVLLHRITYLDSLKIDEQSLGHFATALRRRAPSLIFGHAHSLYLFAKYLEARSAVAK